MNETLLNPSSPLAQDIWDLSIFVLIICSVIFLVVAGLMTTIIIRFRQKSTSEQPRQVMGNTKYEILWTIGPALIVAVLAIMTIKTMYGVDPPASDRDADLIITGHQWWWEAEYPNSGVVAANEIHIPVGKRLLVRLEAFDVIHSFWVPSLNRKMDAIPGHPNYMYLEASEPGLYKGQCTEFCGAQHAKMLIRVIAEPEAQFRAWQQAQLRVAPAPSSGLALQGFKLYKEKTCLNCHAVNIGPDLNHVASRETLGSGIIPNNHEMLVEWLRNPKKYKPYAHMPDFQLSLAEAKAIAAYLETRQ